MDKVKKLFSGSKDEDERVSEVSGTSSNPLTAGITPSGSSPAHDNISSTTGGHTNVSAYDERNQGNSGVSSDGLHRGGQTSGLSSATPTTAVGSGSGTGPPISALSGTTGTKEYGTNSTGQDTSGVAQSTGYASSSINRDPITQNAPQIGSSNAPQVGKPDLGERFDHTSATTPSTTATSTTHGTSASTLTGATLTDRSVAGAGGIGATGVTSTSGVGAIEPPFEESRRQFGDSHPTFTGNRLDPRFHESTSTYHEEKLDDETHRGGGWKAGSEPSAVGTASSRTTSGAVVGAGAAGAAGGPYGSTLDGGPASKTIGPHESNLANIVDPRVQPDPKLQDSESKQTSGSHTGRNAALGGGAAAVGGAGAYEAYESKHTSGTTTAAATGHSASDSHAIFRDDPTGPKTTFDTDRHIMDSDYPSHPASGAAAFRKDPTGIDGTNLGGGPPADNYTKAGGFLSTDAPTTTDHTDEHGHGHGRDHMSTNRDTSAVEEEKKPGFISKLLHRDHPNKLHKDPPS